MYQGFLVKIGSFNFPMEKIKADTYNATPDSRQDLDSFRDGNGVLHRSVVEHTITKIEFETMPMNESEWLYIMNGISSNYTNSREKKCRVTYYNALTGLYDVGDFYIPDIVPSLHIKNGVVQFYPIRLALIEY